MRKAWRNANAARSHERVYLGSYEIYRERVGTELRVERETLHIADDTGRIALLETRTVGEADSPPTTERYQYGNHLGTVALELDGSASLISYEEFIRTGAVRTGR